MTDQREFERRHLVREKVRNAVLRAELEKLATDHRYASSLMEMREVSHLMVWAMALLDRADSQASLAFRIEGVDLGKPFDQAVMDEARALRDAGMSLDEVTREMDSRGCQA